MPEQERPAHTSPNAPLSRRALVLGGLAMAVTTVAELFGRPRPVSGADDGPREDAGAVRLGETNVAEGATTIERSAAGPAVVARSAPSSAAAVGITESGVGLLGVAQDGIGVVGESETGPGISARSRHGIALHVQQGRIRAEGISGHARLARGDGAVIVRPVPRIPADAVVLLTPAGPLDGRELWVTVARDGDLLTINISEPPEHDLVVNWLALG